MIQLTFNFFIERKNTFILNDFFIGEMSPYNHIQI